MNETEFLKLISEKDPTKYFIIRSYRRRVRRQLLTLFFFEYEIAKITSRLSEEMTFFMRLAWWRDHILSGYKNNYSDHYLIGELVKYFPEHQFKEHLIKILDLNMQLAGIDLLSDSDKMLEKFIRPYAKNMHELLYFITGDKISFVNIKTHCLLAFIRSIQLNVKYKNLNAQEAIRLEAEYLQKFQTIGQVELPLETKLDIIFNSSNNFYQNHLTPGSSSPNLGLLRLKLALIIGGYNILNFLKLKLKPKSASAHAK